MEEQQIDEMQAENVQEESVSQEMPQEEAQDYGQFEDHIRGLQQQAESLRQSFPDFELREALLDPVFLQLTAPGTGISVEDAYYALHRKEIQQATAQAAREKLVTAIQSGARRPLEAGTTGQGPSLTTFSYSSATKEQRDAFKKELRRAWGRGETVYAGR